MEQVADIPFSYGWLSLIPSLIAIGMALITRQVFVSLFLGLWAGAWLLAGGGVQEGVTSFFRVADTYLLQALVPENGDGDRMSILLFSLMVGGMVGVISRNGGMAGIINYLMRRATTRFRALLSVTGLGGLIFFDDYANTLIVGNTMRPLTDRLGISREKLAFLVDSTAAPVASIAVVTTWFAF